MNSLTVQQDVCQKSQTCKTISVTACDLIKVAVQDTLHSILKKIQDSNCVGDALSENEILKMKDDKYAYTKTQRFTSEIFKLEIGNLPKFFGYGECKKLLSRKLKLKPHKVNVVKHIRKAYVTFKNENDKEEALKKLKSYEFKGRKLEVKNAKPKADAMATQKRSLNECESAPDSKRQKENEPLSSEETLKNTVIPWWRKTYEQQLDDKHETMCRSLVEVRKRLSAIDSLDVEIFRWLMQQKKQFNRCCPTKFILPSPVTSGYRNKCGFTVGYNLSGSPDVGFRLGKYREQKCAVESPSCLVHVPDLMKKVTSLFAEYVRKSKLSVYDKQLHMGHWRQLLLRTTQNNAIMAVVAMSQQDLTNQDLENEKKAVKDFFKASDVHLDTLLFRIVKDESFSYVEGTPAVAVDGEGVIYENLFDLKFRISPDAFFQCNTLGAEVLYDCVRNMVLNDVVDDTEFSEGGGSDETVLLDVCCGTGTIGLSLARSVKRVIGIDVCKQAIEDAKLNAKLNDINNVQYHCGKAEDQLPDLIQSLPPSTKRVIAVVDPPRSGLHPKVLKAIRQCPFVKKLVYVSCSVDQARSNFVDLCRPQSKRTIGLPFKPILAQPIDLFPHTAHCELVLLFERIVKDPVDSTKNTTTAVAAAAAAAEDCHVVNENNPVVALNNS